MVSAISSLMEFCYLVRCNVINEEDIIAINTAVAKFHVEHSIFDEVRPDGYSLPRQHSLITSPIYGMSYFERQIIGVRLTVP